LAEDSEEAQEAHSEVAGEAVASAVAALVHDGKLQIFNYKFKRE
jgi:hypothetical protein